MPRKDNRKWNHNIIEIEYQKLEIRNKKWKYKKDKNGAPKEGEKERCSGSYCQAVGFLVIKDDSISERPG